MTFPNHMTLVTRDGAWFATCLRCGHRIQEQDLHLLQWEMQKHPCKEERELGSTVQAADEV